MRRRLVVLGVLCVTLAACASPVRGVRVDRTIAHRDLSRSAITTGEPSWPTRDVLFEQGLFEAFGERPEAAIADLHRAMVAARGDQNLLFALAELSFLHGQAVRKPAYQLAAVVYAYAFLFPEGGARAPGPFDPRFRIAADLYNWGLTTAFASEDGSEVLPRGGTFELPFGRIEIAFDPIDLRAGDRELYRFIPVAELEVHGLAMRYRSPGIGAPLAASTRLIDASRPGRDLVAPRLQVPVTALLRIADARHALVQGQPLTATLELHVAWDAESVSIAGREVPLESEPTAALVPSAVDNMSPRHPFIRALQEISVAPSIKAPLHHRGRGGRSGRVGRRRRGGALERPHRWGRVRADREVEPFHARKSLHHPRSAPYSPAARGSRARRGAARDPMMYST